MSAGEIVRQSPGPAPADVYLRDVTPEDIETLYTFERDPVSVQMAAVPSRELEPFTAHWLRIMADETVVAQVIVADGPVVGSTVSWVMDGTRLVGYWIDRAHWGRGIASRALALLVALLPDRPLHARVARHNVGSARVLEKCGFVVVGVNPPTDDDPVEELVLELR